MEGLLGEQGRLVRFEAGVDSGRERRMQAEGRGGGGGGGGWGGGGGGGGVESWS